MIKSLMRYPGSKFKLLRHILPFLDVIVAKTKAFADVFVGGGSVLLNVAHRYPDIKLFANDKDRRMFGFWKLLADNKESEIQELKVLVQQPPTIDLFYRLRAQPPTNDIEAAYHAIFFNRCSFSGDMRAKSSPIGGKFQVSKYKIDCRYNTNKLLTQIDTLRQLVGHRTTVTNHDVANYQQVMQDPNVALYLDPPYIKAGKMLYDENMSQAEHIALGHQLQHRTNWVLSYDNHPLVLEIYKQANIYAVDVQYCIKGHKQSWNNTRELLITPA